MANHKSAEKRVRQNAKRNEINRSNRSRVRTQIKKLRMRPSQRAIKRRAVDCSLRRFRSSTRAVNKGLIHKNTAARYKSRLTKHVAEIG